MSPRRAAQADLGKVFGSVTRVLKENRESLNTLDDYNHNHGDNMVDTFQTITQAMREKKGSPPSEQLNYAGQKLSQQAQSGSAKLYAQGLTQAAEKFAGQSALTPQNAMTLLQSLMGSQGSANQAQSGLGQSGAGDLLSALMGGQGGTGQGGAGDLLNALMGAGQAQAESGGMASQAGSDQGQAGMNDLLGALLGGQAAPTQTGAQQGGVDLNMLLNAGMAFMQARQEGAPPVQALAQAVVAGSQMSASTHRAESGQLVASTVINLIGSMLGGKK